MPKGKKLSLKQKRFADDYIETGNATEAAERNYNVKNRNVAKSLGNENLTKPDIMAYIADKAADASSMIYKLSQNAKAEGIRYTASKDILDRAGYKPVDKSDITSQGEKIIIIPAELMKKNESPSSTE